MERLLFQITMIQKVTALNTSRMRRNNLENKELIFIGTLNGIILLQAEQTSQHFKIDEESFKKHFNVIQELKTETDLNTIKSKFKDATRL